MKNLERHLSYHLFGNLLVYVIPNIIALHYISKIFGIPDIVDIILQAVVGFVFGFFVFGWIIMACIAWIFNYWHKFRSFIFITTVVITICSLTYHFIILDPSNNETEKMFINALLIMDMIVFSLCGAGKLKLGEIQEDSSYVSGSHYEITFDSDGNGTAKEVNDYSGGGEWIVNALLFLFRMILVLLGGVIIFIFKAIRIITHFPFTKWEASDDFLYHYSGNKSKIKIPYKIKVIADNALRGSNMKVLKIGNKVEEIGNGAFSYCSQLKRIELSDNIRKISGNMLAGCTQLEAIRLKNNIKIIGYAAFKDCKTLKEITIPNSVEQIESFAFSNCDGIRKIVLNGNIKRINKATFQGCKNLKEIVIPNSVEYIEENAFEGCCNLQSITLSNNLIEIKNKAFNGCNNLISIIIPTSVKKIASDAFSNCPLLTIYAKSSTGQLECDYHYTIIWNFENFYTDHQGVKYCFFNGDTAIVLEAPTDSKKIVIPDCIKNHNIIQIRKSFFDKCTELRELTIPKSISYVDLFVFHCKKLKKLIFNGSREEWGKLAVSRRNLNTPVRCLDGYWYVSQ